MRLRALLVGFFLGCTPGGDVTDRPTGVSTALQISGPAATTVVMVGTTVSIPIHVDRTKAFEGEVLVEVRMPAAGVSVAPLTIPAGAVDATLAVVVDPAAAQGPVDLTVVGQNPSGVTTAEAKVSVFVRGKPGDLDTTYGVSGISAPFSFRPIRAAQDESGNIVIVGTKTAPDGTGDIAVGRLGKDGAPDPKFGTGGMTAIELAGNDFASGVAFTSDSRILVGGAFGSQPGAGAGQYPAVLRLSASGVMDTHFGVGGRAAGLLGSGYFATLAVQPNGAIFAGGSSIPQGGASSVETLVRFTADGEPDLTFGVGGVVRSTLDSGYGGYVGFQTILLDGNAVTVGGTFSSIDGQIIAENAYIGRYTASGILDSTFGPTGTTVVAADGPAPDDSFSDLARTADHKLLALVTRGTAGASTMRHSLLLARMSADGILDGTFGTNGTLQVPPGPTGSMGYGMLAIQSDGKFLFDAATSISGAGDVYLSRRMSDGSPDTSFGNDGVAPVDGLGKCAYSSTILLQPDGRIVVVYATAPAEGAATARFWN